MKTYLWAILFVTLILVIVVPGVWYANKQLAPSSPSAPQVVEASSSLPATPVPCVADGTITKGVGPSKSTLYLLCLQLNSSTLLLNNPDALSGFQNDDGQFEGGEFQVIVRSSAIPVTAPGSCKGIIVRMPWTFYTQSPDAKVNIAAKKALYDQISALKSSSGADVNVVLELNPYVTVVQANPLALRLTECNVFFRDVAGKYTPSLN
jgi:hypothetical protein